MRTLSNVDRTLKDRVCGRSAQSGRSTEAVAQNVPSDNLAGDQNHEINLADAMRHRFAVPGALNWNRILAKR
jgi:hypothetical protein